MIPVGAIVGEPFVNYLSLSFHENLEVNKARGGYGLIFKIN
jgi:hypothetical protein